MSKRRMVILGSTVFVAMALVLGLAATMDGRSEAQSDGQPLDHFLSYQIKSTPFEPKNVGLKDQFDSGVFEVIEPVALFNPTRKLLADGTGTGVSYPEAHLKGYAIRQIDGEHRSVNNLLVTNQFGTFLVDTIGPRLLLVPTAKIRLEEEPDEAEAAGLDRNLSGELAKTPLNHFKCYGISTRATYDTEGMLPLPLQLGLRDQFREEGFEVLRPVLLCNPAAKIHDGRAFGIEDREAHLMCFEARPTDGEPLQQLARTLNQFGPALLTTVRESQLCLPSGKHHPAPQPSSGPLDDREVN